MSSYFLNSLLVVLLVQAAFSTPMSFEAELQEMPDAFKSKLRAKGIPPEMFLCALDDLLPHLPNEEHHVKVVVTYQKAPNEFLTKYWYDFGDNMYYT